MNKKILLFILLAFSLGIIWGQQADPRAAFEGVRTYEGETIVTNIKDLIPSITVVTTKTNTTPPVGMFDYKFNQQTIIEKSVNLIKNWRKESK